MSQNNSLEKIPCTVGIIVFNREASLRATLESIKDFAEVIVCDGGSTDKTLDIAREFGCTTIEQDSAHKNPNNTIADFAGVRNQTLAVATYDWFMFIDSDEYLSPEAVTEIRDIVGNQNQKNFVYNMPRRFVFEEAVVDCAVTYPSYQTRLFHKKAVTSFEKKIHERIGVSAGYATANLRQPVFVPMDTYDQKKKKAAYYIGLEVDRCENISLGLFGRMCVRVLVSIPIAILKYLWLQVTCKGVVIPWHSEYLRHRYQLHLHWALGKRLLFKK